MCFVLCAIKWQSCSSLQLEKKDLPLSDLKKKDNLGGVFGFQDIISAGMHAGDVGVHVRGKHVQLFPGDSQSSFDRIGL